MTRLALILFPILLFSSLVVAPHAAAQTPSVCNEGQFLVVPSGIPIPPGDLEGYDRWADEYGSSLSCMSSDFTDPRCPGGLRSGGRCYSIVPSAAERASENESWFGRQTNAAREFLGFEPETAGTRVIEAHRCIACFLFEYVEAQKSHYTANAVAHLVSPTLAFLQLLIIGAGMIYVGRLMFMEFEPMEAARDGVKQIAIAIFAVTLLTQPMIIIGGGVLPINTPNDPSVILAGLAAGDSEGYVVTQLQSLTNDISIFIIQFALQSFQTTVATEISVFQPIIDGSRTFQENYQITAVPFSSVNERIILSYAHLWWHAESIIYPIFYDIALDFEGVFTIISGGGLARLLLMVVFILPLGIFLLTLLMAQIIGFIFGITYPVLVLFLFFRSTRPIVWQALKYVLGSALAVIFSSAVLGLSISMVGGFATELLKDQPHGLLPGFTRLFVDFTNPAYWALFLVGVGSSFMLRWAAAKARTIAMADLDGSQSVRSMQSAATNVVRSSARLISAAATNTPAAPAAAAAKDFFKGYDPDSRRR